MRFAILFGCLLMASSLSAIEPPATRKSPVTDEYHGTAVTENYRWLEDWNNREVKQWSDAQNKYARLHLDGLPGVDRIRQRVTEILSAKTASYWDLKYRGERLFAMKRQPPKQQPFIVVMESWNDPDDAKVVFDPSNLDSDGTTAINWFFPSPDGKLIAVSLATGGSEMGDLHIYETDSGRELTADRIPMVNSGTAGGSMAWAPDGTGFFCTRHFKINPDDPADINVYQQVFFHKLGTSYKDDRYELGKGFPQIAEIQLNTHDASGRLLATVQEGDGGQFAHYLRAQEGNWRQFSEFGDRIVQAVFGPSDDLYVVTLKDAPRGEIVRVSVDTLDMEDAQQIIAEGEDAIVTSGEAFWGERTVMPTKSRLFVRYQLGGPSEIRAFDLNGNKAESPRQLEVSAVHGLLSVGGDNVLFGNSSFIEPDAYYHFSPRTGETKKTAVGSESTVKLDDAQVLRKFATSKDGTKVPLNIIMPQGIKLDGSNPCIVTGYGGYGVNIEPGFRALNRLLLDHGVIFVVTNLRGGGEFGEQWHRQGNLTNKQNVFDDFAACLRYLIAEKYTNSERLGIVGGSNGGLLMGATFTQNPDLMKAVVSSVGIYDMLRVELSANGAFNITEFGTVKNEDHFKALYAYSPYHHVEDSVNYPAVLFVTGANDPRVDPMQSRKMTASLQAATASDQPILLRTDSNAGHGQGHSLNQRIEQSVDVYAFLFDQLGVDVVE